MNLWRLEVLRLMRTRRWLSIVAVLIGFGFLSPLTVKYLADIIEQFGGGHVRIIVPEPQVTDGMREFVGNTQQLGILAVVLVTASALAFDTRPEAAAFLRSRVDSTLRLLLPRYSVNAAFAALAFLLGSLAAWYETEVLLGSLPATRTVAAIASGMLFEAFVVTVVTAAAGIARSFVQTTILAVALLISLPVLGLIDALEPWLPSRLSSMLATLDVPRETLDYLRPALVALASIPLALWFTAKRLDGREV